MKRTPYYIYALLALFVLSVAPVQAQKIDVETEDGKVTIVTKTIDENGDEVVKVIERKTNDASGSDSDITIIRGGEEGVHIDIDDDELQNLNINVDVNDGHKRIRVTGQDKEGNDVDFEWEGNGDLPDDVRQQLENLNIHHLGDDGKSGAYFFQCDDRPFLGVVMNQKVTHEETDEGTKNNTSFVVERVVSGSAAEAAGLQSGDIITAVDGQSVSTIQDLKQELDKHKVGDNVALAYLRGEQEQVTQATLKSQERGSSVGRKYRFHQWGDQEEDFNFDVKGQDFDFDFDFDFDEDFDFDHGCRPFIGVNLNLRHGEDATPGVPISSVIPNTPAAATDLQRGDVIVELDGIAVSNHRELLNERNKHEAGDDFTLTVLRDGQRRTVSSTFPACDENSKVGKRHTKVIIIKKNKDELKEEAPAEENIVPENLNPEVVPESMLNLSNFRAFPNPSQDQVTIRFEAPSSPIAVKVTDISGKEIFSEAITSFDGLYNRQVDLSNAPEGTLFLSIQQDGQVFTDKIFKGNLRP